MSSSSSLSAKPASLFERLGGREKLRFLLKHFYADVRQHTLIGPVFGAHIENWPVHLEHVPLGLTELHFEAWLDLWERHCRAHLAPLEARELIAIAHGIGQRLREIISMYGASSNG